MRSDSRSAKVLERDPRFWEKKAGAGGGFSGGCIGRCRGRFKDGRSGTICAVDEGGEPEGRGPETCESV